jgi:hypothetical protein
LLEEYNALVKKGAMLIPLLKVERGQVLEELIRNLFGKSKDTF